MQEVLIFFVSIIIIIIVFAYLKKNKNLESFVANIFQNNTYLNNEGVIPRTNDIRDQIQDFHNQYNDTHSWLWSELVHGNKAVNCSSGYIPDNRYAGPDLSRDTKKFYNRRNGRSVPIIDHAPLAPQHEKGKPISPPTSSQPDTPPTYQTLYDGKLSWDGLKQRSDNPALNYRKEVFGRLPLWNDILDIKSPLDVPHLRLERKKLKSRQKQKGGSPYNPNLIFEPGPAWEQQRTGRTSLVTYKNSILPGQKLPDKIVEDIRLVQPHFLNQVEITQRERDAYYHDARYPRDLVPAGFIKNPRQYCLANLGKYPCYRFISKF